MEFYFAGLRYSLCKDAGVDMGVAKAIATSIDLWHSSYACTYNDVEDAEMSGNEHRSTRLSAELVSKELGEEQQCLLHLRRVVEQQLKVLQVRGDY